MLTGMSPLERTLGGASIGSGLGAGLAGLFGGGDMSGAISQAGQTYQDYLNQALGRLQQEEAAGKGALGQYYQQALGFGAPYRQAGTEALSSYLGTLGLAGPEARQKAVESFRESPGYQYALQQGLQGVQRGMAARGMVGSGAEARELQREGQGLASQEYGQFQQRLAGLAGAGQTAAEQAAQGALGTGRGLAQLGLGYGQTLAGLYGTMGQAQAEAQLAAARAREAAAAQRTGGLGSALGGALGALAGWGL